MKYRINDYNTSYSFNAAAKTITFDVLRAGSHYDLKISDILLILNAEDSEILYRFEDATKGGTLSGTHNRVLTLDYDTTAMSDTDELLIYVDTPDYNTKYDAATTYYVESSIAQRGQYFPVDLHAKVASEGFPSMEGTIYSMESSDVNEGILQVFRASSDNIHDILFACKGESSSTARVLMFNMEYASNAAADADWLSTNSSDWDVKTSTIRYAGSHSLRLDVNTSDAEDETVTHTFGTVQDWSTSVGLDFRARCSQESGALQFFIRDTANHTATLNVSFHSENVWYLKEIVFSDMTNIGNVDLSIIDEIGFVCLDAEDHPQYYIDEMYLTTVDPSVSIPVDVELYDFGTNANPTTIGTPMTLDAGETYVTRNVTQQARVHNVHVHKGSHAPGSLTVGNYYGLYFKRPSFGVVHFMGSTSSQGYTSGKTYTVNGTTTSVIASKSLGFAVFTNVPGVITDLSINFGADAHGTHLYLFKMDGSNKMNQLVLETEIGTETNVRYDFPTDGPKRIHTDEYNNLSLMYGDSLGSSVEKVLVQVGFNYKSFPLYG